MNILLAALGRCYLFIQSDIIGLEFPSSCQLAGDDDPVGTYVYQSVIDCAVDRE